MIVKQGRECPHSLMQLAVIGGRITFLLGVFLPLTIHAGVYRCSDSEGGVIFQAIACADGHEVTLDVATTEWVVSPSIVSDGGDGKKKKVGSKTPRKKVATAESKQKMACWKKEQKIEKIEWTLRKGYKPARGELLRQQRRQHQDYLRQFCR